MERKILTLESWNIWIDDCLLIRFYLFSLLQISDLILKMDQFLFSNHLVYLKHDVGITICEAEQRWLELL